MNLIKSPVVLILCMFATAACAQDAAKRDPRLAPIEDQPRLPRVLLIGDSVSEGYTHVSAVGHVVVIGLGDLDGAGHKHGWLSAEQLAMMARQQIEHFGRIDQLAYRLRLRIVLEDQSRTGAERVDAFRRANLQTVADGRVVFATRDHAVAPARPRFAFVVLPWIVELPCVTKSVVAEQMARQRL